MTSIRLPNTGDLVQLPAQVLYHIKSWLPVLGSAAVEVVEKADEMLRPQYGYVFIRLAGLSGMLAVGLGAYGAHYDLVIHPHRSSSASFVQKAFKNSEASPELKLAFETGNRYHFLHTLALLAVPSMRRPYLVGSLMIAGMTMFSGSCYYHALTGSTTLRRITPYGGIMLMIAWLSMAF